jgi:hypothetical protein
MDVDRDPQSCSKWIFKTAMKINNNSCSEWILKTANASITLRYQTVCIPNLGFFESYRKPKKKRKENYDIEFLERSLNIISRETQFNKMDQI